MTFAAITQRITGNAACTFDFTSYGTPIGDMIYGIQQFSVKPPVGHHLQNIGFSYEVSADTGPGHQTVEIIQQVAAGADLSTSYADVAVLAFLGGTNPPNISLTNQTVPMGASGSSPIQPKNPPTNAAAVLGGFVLSFSNDALLTGLGASAGISCVPGSPDVTPVASGALLGDSAFSGTVDAGAIVLGPGVPGIFVQAEPFSAASTPVDASAPFAPKSVAVLVQSFYTQFWGEDYAPFFDSLTVGASNVQCHGSQVSATVGIDLEGTALAPGPTSPERVTSTVGTALVVATQ